MCILKLAKIIWENSSILDFGDRDNWDTETFKKSWHTEPIYKLINSPGLYWFITDLTYDEMHNTRRPSSLPESGCDIGYEAHEKIDLFNLEGLPKYFNKKVVVYNGHEKNVKSRIRNHFNLNNNKTGALGLTHYNLSNKYWGVRFFTLNMLNESQFTNSDTLKKLINSPIGRSALENAWRSIYGWPVLCRL